MKIFFDILTPFITLTVLGVLCAAALVLLDAPTRQTGKKKAVKKEKEEKPCAVTAGEE
ncbi:MAG: hypothetical protein IKU65_01535 [Oscillospiraceae bacterium]|nr:hypothetical protein [Oscillospiraceae bacterium]